MHFHSLSVSRRHFLATIGLIAGATALAACGEPDISQPPSGGGKLELLLQEPRTLDPALASDPNEFTILQALFEPLVSLNATGVPVPASAESWTETNGGLTIEFTMHDEARWGSGETVTASAFAYAWRRNLYPEIGGAFNYLLFPILGARDFAYGLTTDPNAIGVSAISDRTLRVRLEKPSPGFPARVAAPTFYPLPEGEITSYGSTWTRPRTLRSNGAYRLAQWDKGLGITLFRNEHYRGDPGAFSEIAIRFPQEDSSTLVGFRGGTIDAAPVSGQEYRLARDDDHLRDRLRIFERSGTWFLVFNTAKAPWDQANVRRALGMVLDREALVAAVFDEPTVPGWSIVPPSILPRDIHRPGPDIVGARDLLTQAGFPNGQGLPPIRFSYHTTGTWSRLADHLTETWSQTLGLVVQRDERNWRDFLDFTDDPGDFDLYRGGWTSEFADPSNWYDELWHSDMNYLRAHWQNDAFDNHVRDAARAPSAEARRLAYLAADAVLEDEQPAIGIGHHADAYLLHPRVTGFRLDEVTGAIDLQAVRVKNAPA